MAIPTDREYTTDHEWVRFDGEVAVVGITEFAVEALGDVVTAAADPGSSVSGGAPCGEIESTKSVSDLAALLPTER
jgi:glycine cleavage system H protein